MAAETKAAAKAAGPFKARFATGGRLAPVEEWLKQNIEGDWKIQMDSVSDDMSKKNYSVIFAVEADRDSFKSRYILGEAAYKQSRAPVVKRGFFSRMFGPSTPTAKPTTNPKVKPKGK